MRQIQKELLQSFRKLSVQIWPIVWQICNFFSNVYSLHICYQSYTSFNVYRWCHISKRWKSLERFVKMLIRQYFSGFFSKKNSRILTNFTICSLTAILRICMLINNTIWNYSIILLDFKVAHSKWLSCELIPGDAQIISEHCNAEIVT